MPILKFQQVNKNISWALWEITESLEELLQKVTLQGEDKELLNTITHEKKKKEWLASRLTIRFLVEQLGEEFKGIEKDEFNKPHLKESSYHISISHAYPLAVAILNKCDPTGIDIETPSDKLKKIAGKFLSKDELQFAGSDTTVLSICWSAKEALYKIFGRKRLIFKQNLEVLPFELNNGMRIEGKIKVNGKTDHYLLQYESFNDKYIVYSI
ncbi:4'-phosphopantetheinyl transferase superfamily protein [Fulvivirgaceae bacterium BMA10]|uniref:4'-phosphopantetheinyl transferase superfamily protein n=1 Tax=Splendidivirga corallicola TaxID=3051826 RepID=A0ABT8KS32_9BACT|nr:4'-phosphopantetheinyl transferase superfamily protein [Fulvivirgaceae bacterium BMA10]